MSQQQSNAFLPTAETETFSSVSTHQGALVSSSTPTHNPSQHIAFVDAGIGDLDTLIQGLEDTRVVVIDSAQNGLDQITTTLAQHSDLKSVHIFSHGANGTLQLGNATLDSHAIENADNNTALQQWRTALAESADLLFYGCDLAAGAEGMALINRISKLTGADVAASNDLTGIGGDWVLEATVGEIESEVALSLAAQSAFSQSLALLTNGGFEDADLSDWNPFTGSEVLSTTQSASGTQSLQLAAAGSGVTQILDAIAGETYTLISSAKSSSSGYTGIGLNFFDENYNVLDSRSRQITNNNWNTYRLEGTAVEGSRFVQVWAYKDDSSGNFFVDDLSLDTEDSGPPVNPPTAGDELLDNAGFETGLANWSGFEGSEAVSTSDSFTGENSLQLTAADSGVAQIIDATAGEEYLLTAYAKSSSNDYVGFGLNFFDADYTLLSGTISKTVIGSTWEQYSDTSTAPAGTQYAQVWTYKSGSTGNGFFDDISLSINSTQPPTDTDAPTAELSAETVTTGGTTLYTFEVTYSDETAVDTSTLGNGDIRVTGPNGFAQNAEFVSVDNPAEGSPRTATYQIDAPGSGWQETDNGTYTIRLRNQQVGDTLNNLNAAAPIGTFEVTVEGNPVSEPGFLSLQESTLSVNEDAGSVEVVVVRTGGSDGEVSIDYNTVSGAGRAATAGEDYTARSGTLTFAEGETEKSVIIPILDDALAEGSETIGFTIDNIEGGATLLAPRTAQITINDDESFVYLGNEYVLTSSAKTWEEAQAEAESLGGNLVSINAAAEEDWLQENFGSTESFWIGLNDVATEGEFEWASGEIVTYTNWATNEPNNDQGNQDYGRMNFGITRQWDDMYSDTELRGIIELGGFNGPANPVEGNGNGLRAEYYDNRNFTDLVVTRTDKTIDFNWRQSSPDLRIGNNTFSARWSGQIEAEFTETYTFQTRTDDGVRLWIDDALIINKFIDQGPTAHTASINLEAGQKYDIRMDYYENTGGAVAELSWSSDSQPLEIIPESQLYSEPVSSTTLNANTIVEELNSPTAVDWRPGSDQMFIAEKGGKVEIFEDGNLLPTPFIDISDQVNGVRDRGLLDIALHPDFEDNPYVYLLFTYDPPEVFNFRGGAGPDGENNRAARLIRVTADASNDYRTAVEGSEVILLGKNSTWDNFNGFVNSTDDLDEPEAGRLPNGDYLQDFLNADSESHTIGSVEFGPDGALYVSNGDGASYNQVDPRAARVQDIDSLSGKILRIDPITGKGLPDNPFYDGDADANRSKVYQLGLRNPFRMSINPDSGQVYVGDVGWITWEEINAAGPGANFGWPYYEGGDGVSLRTGRYQNLPEARDFYNSGTTVTPSLLGLNHTTDNINAIVMGDVYTGSVYGSEYQGDLFFNALDRGIVRHVSLDDNGNVTDVSQFATDSRYVVQMAQGPDELLYYVNLIEGTVGRWEFVESV